MYYLVTVYTIGGKHKAKAYTLEHGEDMVHLVRPAEYATLAPTREEADHIVEVWTAQWRASGELLE